MEMARRPTPLEKAIRFCVGFVARKGGDVQSVLQNSSVIEVELHREHLENGSGRQHELLLTHDTPRGIPHPKGYDLPANRIGDGYDPILAAAQHLEHRSRSPPTMHALTRARIQASKAAQREISKILSACSSLDLE
jgi:hypothetical protein